MFLKKSRRAEVSLDDIIKWIIYLGIAVVAFIILNGLISPYL
jgi:hypothetical protein